MAEFCNREFGLSETEPGSTHHRPAVVLRTAQDNPWPAVVLRTAQDNPWPAVLILARGCCPV